MRKNIHLSFICFALSLGAFKAVAQSSPTAPAQGFNVFLQNGARLVNNETEGPMAMGGNLTIDGGYQVSTNYPGTFRVHDVPVTLVVGGKVIYSSGSLTIDQNGYVKIGDCTGSTMWYTDMSAAYSPIRITPTSDYNSSPRINLQVSSNTIGVSAAVNPICESGLIDFASAFTQMKATSTCISTKTDNAVVTNSGGTPIAHTGLPGQIKLNLNTGTNVLNVTGSDLNNVTDFIYNNSPDATHVLIINVNAAGSFSWHVPNSGGIGFSQCPYILYNFYNTTSLDIAGYGAVEGTVFAPFADITKSSNMSNIEGQVIAQSYYHGGGENHYAVFTPIISGCSGALATTAAYTINNSLQCLSGNSFSFTNTTTGTSPFAYTWKFGDGSTTTAVSPVKTYTAQGTYSVKLIATGAGGTDSVTHTVTVSETPSHGFTINNATQAVTGNSFTFTSNGTTTGNTYSWSFSDGTTSTAVNPTVSFSLPGDYLIGQTVTRTGGCSYYSCQYVSVTSDGVGGGGGGGLESVSLGDLVSKRDFNNVKNGVNTKPDYTTMPVFAKPLPGAAAKGTGSSVLQRLIPASLDAATTPKISTPTDITKLTAAVDVFSLDYTSSDNYAKAVVLAITTTGKPYNHTKSICDRFRGAELLNTSIVNIQGYNFIQFALRQRSGNVEYCIAFAAGKANGGSKFDLQSKWLISEYAADDSVFNFQVWATTPANSIKLTNDVLNNLKSILPVQQIDMDLMSPPAYISTGKRNKGFLDIAITSAKTTGNARIVFIERINELAGEDTLQIPFNIIAGSSNFFSLPVKDGYEYEGHLYVDDTLTDDVYMADGNWSLDYDNNLTSITNYKPNNNFNRVYVDNEYPLYRSIQVNASTSDYISIYKYITSGDENVDLSAYHSYKFYAKGTGKVQIRLIKDSVVKWADQYYMTEDLDPSGKSYSISFDDFTSDTRSQPFSAKDLKAVVYTFIMNGVATDFSFFADEQSFSPESVVSIKALQSKLVSISPNPTTGQFTCKFNSDQDRNMDITFTDILGNVVYKQPVQAVVGSNSFSVSLPSYIPQSILLVRVGNKTVQYGITKLNLMH